MDNRIPARNDAMSSCSKHLLPSLSFNWDVRTFWTGWRFKTRLGLLWIGFAGFTYLCLRQWQREECRFQGKGQPSTSKRSGCCPEIPFQIFPAKDPPDPTGPILGLLSSRGLVRLDWDYQTGLMRNVVLLSPVGNFLGGREDMKSQKEISPSQMLSIPQYFSAVFFFR